MTESNTSSPVSVKEGEMSAEFRRRSEALQKRVGYQFNDPGLLRLAFVERSGNDAHKNGSNNQRLEYLGDAALDLLVGEALYQEYPEAGEGFMTIERAKLVCGQNLSTWGYEAGFDQMLRVHADVTVTDDMVEDAVEAVAGAFFLDGGLEAVRSFLQSFSDYPDQGTGFDSRRHLLRDCMFERLGTPEYQTGRAKKNGRVVFESLVILDGKPLGRGVGGDRFTAEREAARAAMIELNRKHDTAQQKRAGILRARYRRSLIRRLPGRVKPVRGSNNKTPESRRQDNPHELLAEMDGVRYYLVNQTGPAHRPVFTVAVQRDGRTLMEMNGPSKKKALSEARKAFSERVNPEDPLSGINLKALEGTPHIKGTFQMWSERLNMGQPKYKRVSSRGRPGFRVELCLSGNVLTAGCGQSIKDAGQDAAWKALQLLVADSVNLNADRKDDAEKLCARFERVLRNIARGKFGFSVYENTDKQGVPFVKISSGRKLICEISHRSRFTARVCALVRAAENLGMWKEALERLGVSVPETEGDNSCTPVDVLPVIRKNTELIVLPLSKDAEGDVSVGAFEGNRLVYSLSASYTDCLTQWCALFLLEYCKEKEPCVSRETTKSVKKSRGTLKKRENFNRRPGNRRVKRKRRSFEQKTTSARSVPEKKSSSVKRVPRSVPKQTGDSAAPDRNTIGERLSRWLKGVSTAK